MTRIPVEKAHGTDATIADTGTLTEPIRELAFHPFESRAGQKILLRPIELPQPIDVDRTAARLDNGILYVTAILQEREREATAV